MKIYLGINITPIAGYTNCDACGGPDKVMVSPSNLDTVCEKAQCTELLAPNVLDYIHGSALISTIKNWTSKLRHGGKLIVGGTDVVTLSKKIWTGHTSTIDANKLLYGTGENVWAIKQGCYSCYDISHILREEGLNIIKQKISGIRYIVEAERG